RGRLLLQLGGEERIDGPPPRDGGGALADQPAIDRQARQQLLVEELVEELRQDVARQHGLPVAGGPLHIVLEAAVADLLRPDARHQVRRRRLGLRAGGQQHQQREQTGAGDPHDARASRVCRASESICRPSPAVRVRTPVGLKLAPGWLETISIRRSTSTFASRRSRRVSSLPLAETDWTRSDSAIRLSAATSMSVSTAGGGGPKRSVSSARISRSDRSAEAI